MVACFKWWIDLYKSGSLKQIETVRSELLNAAVLILGTPGTADEKIIPLSSIQTFLNPRTNGAQILLDGPLPPHLLPNSISRHFDPQLLKASFGWDEFALPAWLSHILSPSVRAADPEHDITLAPPWAERVISVLARSWPSLPRNAQQGIVEMLAGVACVPTSAGMRTPGEAYFQNAHVFPDLPLVKMPSGVQVRGPLEKVLEALGVRKHVELQIVFNR
jgi:hypothetical protein